MIVTVSIDSINAVTTTTTLNRTMTFTDAPFKLRTAESKAAARDLIAQDRRQTGNLHTPKDVHS
jgi:hypothetical protein